jgi:hypothetical protein
MIDAKIQFQKSVGYEHMASPPGIHSLTEREFYDFFVNQFPESTSRKLIFKVYFQLRQIIEKLIPTFNGLMGLLLKAKQILKILMLLYLSLQAIITAFLLRHRKILLICSEKNKPRIKFMYGTDAYYTIIYPKNHPSCFATKTALCIGNNSLVLLDSIIPRA